LAVQSARRQLHGSVASGVWDGVSSVPPCVTREGWALQRLQHIFFRSQACYLVTISWEFAWHRDLSSDRIPNLGVVYLLLATHLSA
jgi:hypothetical protein